MISLDQYFGSFLHHHEVTEEMFDNAEKLLDAVGKLLAFAGHDNIPLPINPTTDSQISGEHYGGFRPQDCPIGARTSAHKQALAIDIYDPHGDLDKWLNDGMLEVCGLYRESPVATDGWCHLTVRAPHSGNRTFIP